MISKQATDERFFALYRDSLWVASRKLEPDNWGILIDRYIQRDDARFAVEIGTAQEPARGSDYPRKSVPPCSLIKGTRSVSAILAQRGFA